ncbi:MAG: glycosyltransferase family 2 protein [Lachnospiraceae bacterium]|jgi:glycosyltransferase involved in cell wall biosynthesis|nr:glycosyltransferase family 2 protein [Lachnospiraceae bacterium]
MQNNKAMVTVLTATYNRWHLLPNLYHSLCKQTSGEFEWLIVDDGSSDETGAEIEKLKKTAPFPIHYVYKENGGKHTALNAGIPLITTDLLIIIDSDDVLKEDAIETILFYHARYSDRQDLCGYSFHMCYPDGRINGKLFSPDERVDTFINVRLRGRDANSDKTEAIYTKILKEYPYPEFPGEKFFAEGIIWIQMAAKYQMVHINKAITITDYLADGLTKNRHQLAITSPRGCMYYAKGYMQKEINLRYRVEGALIYTIYGKVAKIKPAALVRDADYKLLVLIFFLPAMLIYYLRFAKRVKKWGNTGTTEE